VISEECGHSSSAAMVLIGHEWNTMWSMLYANINNTLSNILHDKDSKCSIKTKRKDMKRKENKKKLVRAMWKL